ncbi:Coiled-coil domain-containing protein 42 [Clonorchis sinensis]|uniref:Coiled-coil domain-containing protein 42 n=1 Tax=Clonorchis sinensis TaxID=79923 RepID=A0A419PRA4_CLOSI|nr:Coiled-coil domain-containing protein 42 [Clonorchis sinensis]
MQPDKNNWRKEEVISSDGSTDKKLHNKISNKAMSKMSKSHERTLSLVPSVDGNPIQNRIDNLLGMSRTLWEKRREFNEQMTNSSERREQLKKDVSYLQERRVKCQSIIRENDAKRWRALQKFCTDNHLCMIRKKEKQALNADLRKARQTYLLLSAKAADLRKYEEYMLNVIASLPKDYIKLADDVIAGLMMRYNTLYETNSSLRKEMETKAEEVRVAQSDLKQLVEEHRILLFEKNSELSELYTHRQKMNDLYQGAQQAMIHSHEELAHQLSYFKTVLRSINNLTGKIIRAYEPGISVQLLTTKIQNMPILSRCRLIEDRTLGMRSIIAQLASDTGTLPISTCSRPELDNVQHGAPIAVSASEFSLLTKMTSAQSDPNA